MVGILYIFNKEYFNFENNLLMVGMLYIFNKEYFNYFFNFNFSKPGVAMFSLDSFPPWARIDSGALCAANTRFLNYKYTKYKYTNTNTLVFMLILSPA